jgi:hypothetical protein
MFTKKQVQAGIEKGRAIKEEYSIAVVRYVLK